MQTIKREKLENFPESAQKRARTNPLLACLQFLLFLALGLWALESFFNFAGVGNEEFLEPDAFLGVRHIAGKKVVWRLEGFSDDCLSSAGLRDSEHNIKKPQDCFRIALIGDSATEGLQVPLANTYGKRLEKLIKESGSCEKKVEVINFGCSSYSNGQEALQLQSQIAAYSPDLVILMYNRGDYLENIRDPSTLKAEPRPYFHLDAEDRLLQDNTIMETNSRSFNPDPNMNFLRRESRIYGVLSHLNLALSLNERLYSKIKGSILRFLPASKDSWKHVKAAYTIQDPWKVTARLIERCNYICARKGTKFMLVCFPNTVKDREYAAQIRALEEQSLKQKFQYLDLSPDYDKKSGSSALFLKYHFSSAGHELAAEKIFETIKSSLQSSR